LCTEAARKLIRLAQLAWISTADPTDIQKQQGILRSAISAEDADSTSTDRQVGVEESIARRPYAFPGAGGRPGALAAADSSR
jgi:hypothetical protein